MTKRFWFWARGGKLMAGNLEFDSFEDARGRAREINREGGHSTMGMVEIISDANPPAHGRVTTVDSGVQGNLLGNIEDCRLPENLRK